MSHLWIPLVLLGPLMLLTAVGQYRRGHSVVLALLAGIGFPGAWIAWYVQDERPSAWYLWRR